MTPRDLHQEGIKQMMRSMIFALTLCAALSAVAADNFFEGAPPVPPGYETTQAAQIAVMTGKVERSIMKSDAPDTLRVSKDVVYSSPNGEDLKIDLYVPKAAKTPPPVLLFIHGGGWRSGKKDDYSAYNIRFAELGYATASVQYRLSPEHHFPDAIQDVNCALHWLRENGEAMGFDATRIAVIGGSAGGHLALLAGYSQDEKLNCPGDEAGAKGQIKAIVNLYGVADCTTPEAKAASQVQNFIGAPYDEAAEMYALSSPNHHLDAEDPPTLTFHGTIDDLVPISQADDLHKKLDELGIPNAYDRIEGWPHSMDLAKPISDRCCYVMERFLAKYLPVKRD